MSGVLVVVHPFGRHKLGDVIGDASEMRDCLRGERAACVVATQITASAPAKTKEG